jgi:histidinol-phosphate aminotransferase
MSANQNSAAWLKHIRQDVQSMHAYAIQDSTGMVKLDAMENPFTLPPELQKQLGERLGALALNRYPGDRVNVLRSQLAKYAEMPEGFDIIDTGQALCQQT